MTQRRLVLVFVLLALGVGAAYLLLAGDGRPGTQGSERSTIEPASVTAALAPAAESGPGTATSEADARRALDAALAEASSAEGAALSAGIGAATLRGRVVDERGRPIAGAAVRAAESITTWGFHEPTGSALHDAKIAVAKTDATGAFRVVHRAGPVSLSLRAAGFAPRTITRLLLARGAETELEEDIVLERSALVTGVVLSDSGAPLENARVVVCGADGARVRGAGRANLGTGADGSFGLDQLDRVPLVLLVTHDVHAPEEVPVDASRPGELPHLTIRLARGEVIEGRLAGFPADAVKTIAVVAAPHADGGSAGAQNRSASVDEHGYFRVQGLSRGTHWQVFALPASKLDAVDLARVSARERVSEAPLLLAGERNLVLDWEASCTVRVRVVDANTREPLESLAVRWGPHLDVALEADADEVDEYEDGIVRLAPLRSDDNKPLVIQIDAVNYAHWTERGIHPEPGLEIDLGTIGLVPAPRMCVTVVDDANGAPVAGATVGWTEQDMQVAARFAKTVAAHADAEHAPWRRRSPGYSSQRTQLTDQHGFVSFEGRPGYIMELCATAAGLRTRARRRLEAAAGRRRRTRGAPPAGWRRRRAGPRRER
ncbi:MAG: carboxypeptidase-like regulatory domain-containing protein [Planctomycetota bacterium]